ncbi:MAG: hypothetical protein KME04_16635 [Pleurocapsa minor GSE-CHR-MK-17-07R]|nr:hypothetical protein [Pleurocapsa minor GSE-CHR-MK 17-07R]
MIRFLGSFILALIVAVAVGLYLGWVQFPREQVDRPASVLATTFSDDYTVMIAQGYLLDRDITGALERLRLLQVENIPAHVQEVAERFITNSREVRDLQALVTLSEGLGRLTPIMEPYRPVNQGA